MPGRIIPAYAGSTVNGVTPTAGDKDHPRIRGVHTAAAAITPRKSGSSPHTRGPLPAYVDTDGMTGIIPAYAGSTLLFSRYMV